VIDLLRDEGYEVTERRITIHEIKEASHKGTLEEAFGTGTAVGIAFIQDIGWGEEVIHVSDESPVGLKISNRLDAIKTRRAEDKFSWMLAIEY
jgi:branched-chain amino acid aminotransferase